MSDHDEAQSRPVAPAPAAADSAERRRIQRFLALRRGEPWFWVVIDGERVPLRDISVDGFAITAEAPPAAGEAFAFELHREGVPDRIRGWAQSVNFIASVSQAGCRFLALEGDGSDRLRDWLVALVIMNASVRISEKGAAAIVAGPPLI